MYRMLSAGNLVVSPLKVFTAIAFQSEMTAGSLAPGAGGSAVAGAAARVIKSPAAAEAASQLRAGVLPCRGNKNKIRNARISKPPLFLPVAEVSAGDFGQVHSSGWFRKARPAIAAALSSNLFHRLRGLAHAESINVAINS